jgi:hypothetical protein
LIGAAVVNRPLERWQRGWLFFQRLEENVSAVVATHDLPLVAESETLQSAKAAGVPDIATCRKHFDFVRTRKMKSPSSDSLRNEVGKIFNEGLIDLFHAFKPRLAPKDATT